MKHIFFLLFVLLSIVAVQTVWAQGGTNVGGGGGTNVGGTAPIPNLGNIDPLGGRGITEILQSIANFLAFTLAPPLVAILIIVGALQMIFAAGSSEKVQTGKKTIFWAVIGFLIVLMASGVATLIQNIVGVR